VSHCSNESIYMTCQITHNHRKNRSLPTLK
jgi:hypothetical protein